MTDDSFDEPLEPILRNLLEDDLPNRRQDLEPRRERVRPAGPARVEARRMERAQALINRLPFSKENVALVKEWDDFVEVRWKAAHDTVLSTLVSLRLENPGAAEAFIPAEKEFQTISKALNAKAGFVAPTDLSGLISRLEAASGITLDESNHPVPSDFDPDLKAFQKADSAIRTGEGAAKELATGSVLSRVPWWAWGIGGLAAAGVGYSVVKTGRQVSAKAKRDTDYLNQTFTSKALSGYKG